MTAPARPLAGMSALKLAVMAKKLRAQTDAVMRAEPIAIIGMGCRFPGGADSPDAFWRVLEQGVDAIREVPPDRWDADAFYDADAATPGRANTKWGGFLDHIDGFDPGYFGILPREADRIDPQHRLFLEVATEALDDAGLPRERLRGARAGVFVASYHNDWANLQYGDLESVDARTLTGVLHSVLANRLSFLLDLRGPSLSLDTACSSGLVAVHLACQSLRTGESEVAIAAGVSVMMTPDLMVSLAKGGFMAPDGRCKTFDASANGFTRGEGCGVIVLKRLADAIADGDRVHAVIRGSAVNQDGHSTLLAAPNGLAQQALVREALANAQVDPSRIGFVETHGTGTTLGDPIEVEALAAVLGAPRADGSRCMLGAAKANLGHLEAAAGLVGIIKTALVFQHESIPPQVHFKKLNPHISLEGTSLAVSAHAVDWKRGSTPRLAGVSSFGVGGTNAHVVLEEAPLLDDGAADRDAALADRSHMLAISAHSSRALRDLATSWTELLATTSDAPAALAFTAGARRTHHRHRLAVIGRTREDWGTALLAAINDEPNPNVGRGALAKDDAPRVAFVFCGQGPQWFAMGRELQTSEPVFRDALAECDALITPRTGWSLLDALAADEATSRLNETEVAQPALFAIQVALASMWRSWGVVPSAVVGHSVGEIAAMHVAGILTLADAARVVCERGRIMQRATNGGRMAAAGITAAEANALVAPYGERLSVAALNGPRSVTLSGEPDALSDALAKLTARGVSHRMLAVQYAFHSEQMAPFRAALASAVSDLPSREPAIAFYSTVTGSLADGMRFDGDYFGRNLREPVKLAPAIDAMIVDGIDAFVEIGPHPVLATSLAECLAERGVERPVLASLRRGRPERDTMLQGLAGAYAAGIEPAWHALETPHTPVTLPAYPWQRERHWFVPPRRGSSDARGAAPNDGVLGRRVNVAVDGTRVYESSWTSDSPGWIGDHRVFEHVALPATAMIASFNTAAVERLGSDVTLTELVLHRPLLLPENGAATPWQIVSSARNDDMLSLSLHDLAQGGEWRLVASATAARSSNLGGSLSSSVEQHAATLTEVDVSAFYARFAELGVAFGPSFRVLTRLQGGDGFAVGTIELPRLEHLSDAGTIHPVLLDGALQVCSAALSDGDRLPPFVMLPVGADRVTVSTRSAARCRARASVRREGAGATIAADVVIENEAGEMIARLDGMRFAPANAAAFARPGVADESLYEVRWEAVGNASPAAALRGDFLVFADQAGVGDQLARALTSAGGRCRIVRAAGDSAAGNGASNDTSVDPTDAAAIAQLCRGERWERVVYLWTLDCSRYYDAAAECERDDSLAVGGLLHAIQGLIAAPARLLVVTRGATDASTNAAAGAFRPRAGAAWGLGNVAAVEHPELQLRLVDLEPAQEADPSEIDRLVKELSSDATPSRVALRGDARLVPRLHRLAQSTSQTPSAVQLEVATPGTIDGLATRPLTAVAPRAGEVRVRVLATGLNFRDVLLALGLYPGGGIPLGAECAGEVIEVGAGVNTLRVGDRVCGFAPASFASEVTVPASFLARVPAALSHEDAAALPIAYLTAHYALHEVAHVQKNERVLIHAAAGGVGMAALQLALRAGAEVFATAGSPDKRALLTEMGAHHVMDSRSLAFADEIRRLTNGEGVDVVVNSLAGDFITASLAVTAQGGRFAELGKRDILTDDAAARLRPDVRYRAFDLGSEAQRDHTLLAPMFADILGGLADGSLRLLPTTVFDFDDVGDAFRFMAQARHVGKIVVRAPAARQLAVSSDKSYWITGGLGAIGLATARWLSARGARHLALSGRRAPSAAALEQIRELEKTGVRVLVLAADAGDADVMRAALRTIDETLPPLAGVIHAAGSLDDGVLTGQTWARMRAVMRGKADGAWNLHALLNQRPLDFCVFYSAAGWLLGAAGQGGYAAANAAVDRLATTLRRAGERASSIAWGRWNIGMAAGDDGAWAARGLGVLTEADAFTQLDRLFVAGVTEGVVLPIDWARFLAHSPAGLDRDFFTHVTPANAAPRAENARGAIVSRLLDMPAARRHDALIEHLADQTTHVLGLARGTVLDASRPLKDLGLDSLMAVELRNTLARSTGHPLPATLLFDYPTLESLATHLTHTLGLNGQPAPALDAAVQRDAAADAARAAVSDLTDAEAEAELLRELESR